MTSRKKRVSLCCNCNENAIIHIQLVNVELLRVNELNAITFFFSLARDRE